MGRIFWTGMGSAFLALGAIGVLLPLVPTTPFVLLAAFAFARGSPRLRHWLESHPRFGPPIQDWERYGAIAPRAKRLATLSIVLTFGLSVALGLKPSVLAIQALTLSAVAVFLWTRPDA